MYALESLLNYMIFPGFITRHKPVSPEMFQALDIPRRLIPAFAMPRYHVFTNPKKFTIVEAENAQVALVKSNITNAYKIEYRAVIFDNILAAEKTETEIAAEDNSAAEDNAPAEEKALSNDDVEKLLNS
jgi:hypothetical protein